MTGLLRMCSACALVAVAMLALTAPAAFAAKAGPQVAKCGKLKKKAAKRACLKQNQANRIAFNKIKNGKFVGYRGDGDYVEWTFCANGKYQSYNEDGTYGRSVSSGTSWRVAGATVGKGGKSIDAFINGQGGFEVALQKRGGKWKVAVASLGRFLYPGDATREDAKSSCATLDVS